MRKRKFLLFISVLFCGLVLSGCSRQARESIIQISDVKVTVLGAVYNDGEVKLTLRCEPNYQVIGRFEEDENGEPKINFSMDVNNNKLESITEQYYGELEIELLYYGFGGRLCEYEIRRPYIKGSFPEDSLVPHSAFLMATFNTEKEKNIAFSYNILLKRGR